MQSCIFAGMKDTYRQKGLRKRLVKELREKGIRDERILEAMWELPRHYFLDVAFDQWAYKDTAFRIACEQTISQPYTVARQTELLEVEEGHKVLEIGTGSGYQACILALLGAEVYTIERIEELFKESYERIKQLGYKNVRCFYGDGFEGLPRYAPYDRILSTAAPEEVPETLLEQLKIGGIMVMPVGASNMQEMYKIRREDDSHYKRERHGHYRFVPMKKGTN